MAKPNCARGKPSLFVERIFEEVPVFKLFARSMMGDGMTLVCMTGEAIQVTELETGAAVCSCGGFGG